MPSRREIMYPYFLECCEHTDEPFWEDIFRNLAYGIVPTGTYINKGFLCCNYKNREFSYKIERKNAKTLYNDLYDLFTEKLCILSKKQNQQKKYEFLEVEESIKNSIQSWSGIRKKAIKDSLFKRFVLEKKEQYNFSFEDARKLLSFITLALLFKTITSKDIIYEEGKIQDINGISFEPSLIIYDTMFYSQDYCDTEEDVGKIDRSMKDNWEKFLQTL